MELKYETIKYNEFDMIEAVKEYGKTLSVGALEIAEKHGVPVSELHKEFAKSKAKK